MKAKRTVKKHCKKRGGYKPPRSKRRKRTRQRKRIKKQSGGDLPLWIPSLGIIGFLLLISGGIYFARDPLPTDLITLPISQSGDIKGLMLGDDCTVTNAPAAWKDGVGAKIIRVQASSRRRAHVFVVNKISEFDNALKSIVGDEIDLSLRVPQDVVITYIPPSPAPTAT